MWTMESMATSGLAWTKLQGEIGVSETERDNRAWISGALEPPENLLPGFIVDPAAPASPHLFSYSRQAPLSTARSVLGELQMLHYVRKCGSSLNQNQDWGMAQR